MRDSGFRFLNPADCFTFVMDQEIRRAGLAGGLGAFVLEFMGQPDAAALGVRIDELARRFPLVTARLERRGRRFGWVESGVQSDLLERRACPVGEEAAAFFEHTAREIMNRVEPWQSAAPLSFHLLGGDGRAVLLMRWLHPLLDARGAALIFDYLTCEDPERRSRFGQPQTGSLIDLQLKRRGFWQNFRDFFKAKRHIEAVDGIDSALPAAASQGLERMNFRLQRFNAEESAIIARRAQRSVGLGGKSLYAIGCLMRAIEAVGPEVAGEGYCVPYAFNLRKQKALTPLLGNHVSVLFAQAPRNLLRDRAALFRHLRQQNSDVIRNGIDYAFLPLMWLGQWLPPERYGQVLRRQRSGGERSSFWFSDIGDLDFRERGVFGSVVSGLYFLCQVTAPPSLALLAGQVNGELTLTYNFLEPAVDQEWVARLQAEMARELLAQGEGP